MLFVSHPKILHKHCVQFLLWVKMAPRETENNAYAKFWGDKQRAWWYVMVFLEWSIIVEIPQRDKKAIGLDWQNNNFARASRFLYISLQWLHDYDMKLPNFTFYGGRKHKTRTFLFFFWTSIQSFRIQLPKNCQHSTNWARYNKRDKV